jgi:ABC-2 type transport system ATP-binding protein
MEYCVVGNGIDKSYAAKKVLDNVDIHVPMHKIFGLIGPNGAGKSTLLKCIMNLIRLDGGNIQVFDNPAGMEKHELNRTGSLIEYPYFYDDLTGTENLLIHSRYMGYYDIKRIDEVLDKVDLTKDAKKKVINYSMGMRQRLAIARAILIKPELLILDEPINALDPEGIKKMRELFIQLNAELGTTIIISSHILSEMDFLASDIGIMSNGKLIEEKTLKEIHQENKDKIVARVDDLSKATIILEERGIQNFKVIDDGQIQIFDLTYDTSYFAELFIQSRLKLYQIDVVKKTLEEYFFEVVGGN